MKLAIVYYSESGNTKQAAEYVAEGMKKAGAEVGLFELDKIDEAFVAEAKAVVFGAPTFYADTCWQMKKLMKPSCRSPERSAPPSVLPDTCRAAVRSRCRTMWCGCSARACWYTRAAVHWANR